MKRTIFFDSIYDLIENTTLEFRDSGNRFRFRSDWTVSRGWRDSVLVQAVLYSIENILERHNTAISDAQKRLEEARQMYTQAFADRAEYLNSRDEQ